MDSGLLAGAGSWTSAPYWDQPVFWSILMEQLGRWAWEGCVFANRLPNDYPECVPLNAKRQDVVLRVVSSAPGMVPSLGP